MTVAAPLGVDAGVPSASSSSSGRVGNTDLGGSSALCVNNGDSKGTTGLGDSNGLFGANPLVPNQL